MMKMKFYHLIFVFGLVPILYANNFSQLSIRASIGQGSYKMTDLHDLLDEIIGDYAAEGIALEATSDFPAYYTTQIQLLKYITPKYQIGLVWQHRSTGARLHYSDYSGSILIDIFVNSEAAGFKNIWTVSNRGKLKFESYLQLSGIFSNLHFSNEITVFDEGLKDEFTLKSIGIGIEPGISTTAVLSRLSISLNLGFQQCFSRPLHFTSNKEATLRVHNREATADWSGPRTGVSVGFSF
ncbi:MAG: hypothetical protein HQ507_03095 [Candidatus Marinimicrobia bacterium]|nr:hypothetical protein [Candidatus Neomarinimicrobiota bacterium]